MDDKHKVIKFFSIFFTALALGAGLAHLYAFPNKINLSRDAYFTVQQIYRGWALLGIVFAGQLLSTLLLAFKTREGGKTFYFAVSAFVCVVATLVVFFTFTYPANVMTNNWTTIPDNWQELRNQWEYSHALGALLNLATLSFLTVSILNQEKQKLADITETRRVS
jgi:hypothetical protein